ncbi:MAG TPA: hypothetical protein VFH61_10700, partial [Thermoleophilia bacterium]|nr:hypothetical protein [Thermoleophilia bacterium]
MTWERHARETEQILGSLNDGTAPSSLQRDQCPYLSNIEHVNDGAASKIRGWGRWGEIATVPEVTCKGLLEPAPALTETGTLDGTYHVRLTHWTSVGETDVLTQGGNPVVVTADEAAI